MTDQSMTCTQPQNLLASCAEQIRSLDRNAAFATGASLWERITRALGRQSPAVQSWQVIGAWMRSALLHGRSDGGDAPDILRDRHELTRYTMLGRVNR